MTKWPTLPVLRGFTEIKEIYDIVYDHGGYICGGWVRYMVSPVANPAPSQDVDVYCPDEDTYLAITEALEMIADGIYTSAVSTTFNKFKDRPHIPPVQVIKPRTDGRLVTEGTLQDVLENFDFTICRAGLINSEEAVVDPDFVEDETEKRIRIKNVHCAFGNMMRVMKYHSRGYKVLPSDLIPLFEDWTYARDEEYRHKLLSGLKASEEALRLKLTGADSPWTSEDFRKELYEMMLID